MKTALEFARRRFRPSSTCGQGDATDAGTESALSRLSLSKVYTAALVKVKSRIWVEICGEGQSLDTKGKQTCARRSEPYTPRAR